MCTQLPLNIDRFRLTGFGFVIDNLESSDLESHISYRNVCMWRISWSTSTWRRCIRVSRGSIPVSAVRNTQAIPRFFPFPFPQFFQFSLSPNSKIFWRQYKWRIENRNILGNLHALYMYFCKMCPRQHISPPRGFW